MKKETSAHLTQKAYVEIAKSKINEKFGDIKILDFYTKVSDCEIHVPPREW